ncbi:Serine/threonine-protein kinase PknF [Mycobacterium innocens]|uniref:non-specific serine/threonine protein kinase n=1 Tax=Mycobacterium innocens TaxID=2341083 RepID=A0A498PNZ9_9MYCO|nr:MULTISPECIES: serine/threonine-protein kinase [Mycobacterium]VBA33684.1 Serine/threonine-protein kinase PknF [Mycobacterium innocens]
MPLAVGEVFAGYTILRVLGAGAMGTVYLAQHPRLPRRDALKVLSAELTADAQYRARFVREADIAASLWHPNILGIHDRGESGGQFWISMDFVAGTDAAKLLGERYPGGMALDLAVPIITAVGSALDYAHQRGLLHRDVKPANILIADPGSETQRVFLADFGIARPVDDTAGLTATNFAIGTVAYAAPEQLMGEPIDGRADQYALACTAFHMLTGTQPYQSPSAAAVITKHVMAPPPPIGERRPELAALDPAFARAMAKKPAERFAHCRDFTEHLDSRCAPAPLQGQNHQDTQLAPTRAAPVPPSPRQVGKRPVRRTRVLVAALAAVAVLSAAGVLAAVKLSGNHGRSNAAVAGAPSAAVPSAGPFTGTYRGDYDAATGPGLDGLAIPGATASTTTWGVRSVCRPTGCVATAARLGGETTSLPTMVLDDVGGHWLAVGLTTATCQDVNAEFWVVLILQPRPDGTLSGEFSKTSANGCAIKKAVTFTRTGDVDVTAVSDPASQAPRVVSPAEALHGRYHDTVKWANGATPKQYDWAVRTDCLRTGERCMSFFHAPPDGSKPLVFSSRSWILSTEREATCASGGTTPVKDTAEFALPQPPQDPIMLLTAHGHHQQIKSCTLSVEFDETFERTGD